MIRNIVLIVRSIGIVVSIISLIIISCANCCKNQNPAPRNKNYLHNQEQKRIKGEYIITVKGNCDEFILQKFFYEYGILNIHPAKDNVFIIKFVNDPGLKELTRQAIKTNTIEEVKPSYKIDTKSFDRNNQ